MNNSTGQVNLHTTVHVRSTCTQQYTLGQPVTVVYVKSTFAQMYAPGQPAHNSTRRVKNRNVFAALHWAAKSNSNAEVWVGEVNSQTEALVDGGVGTLAQLLQLVVTLGLAERRVELKQTAHPLARRGLRGLSTQRSQARVSTSASQAWAT